MSSSILNFVSGYIHDLQRIQASIADRIALGQPVMSSAFSAAHAPQLPGTWRRMVAEGYTGVFLRDREKRLLGHYRRPMFQKSGTCVSRGMCRGVQVSLDYSIVERKSLLKPVEISFAPIYSFARHEIGRDRCGAGDGAILSDAARAVNDLGVATTELFPGTSEDDVERMAVKYAAPGVGSPSSWITAAAGHKCPTFWPESLEMIFDCLAAGYAVPYAMNYITSKPNGVGLSDLGSFGPHCRCFVGVYLDENGDTQLESSESWGRYPAGDPSIEDSTMPIDQIPCVTIRYAGGTKTLAPGDVGVNAKRFWSQIQTNGEAWAVGPPKFEAGSVGELVRKAV
jgi:hypothetical protein